MKKFINEGINKLAIGISLIASLFISSHAFATNVTGGFQSTATLAATCSVRMGHFRFNTFTPSPSGELTVNNNTSFVCTTGTPYTVSINAGQNGTVGNRKMASLDFGNTYTLDYNIYTEDGFILGDGTEGTVTLSRVGYGSDDSPLLTAKMQQNQFVRPGTYYDNLVVSVSY